MIELQGQYFDGKTSGGQTAKLVFQDSSAVLVAKNARHSYALSELKLQPRLANISARIEFSDGAVFEAEEQDGLDEVYTQLHKGTSHTFIHKLENKLGYIFITSTVAVAVMFGLIQFGVPQFSKSVAYQIPIEYETSMGEETLRFFDKALCDKSKLKQQQQNELRKKMLGLLVSADSFRVEFRNCEAIGANALALPSGIIIFTDDMVKLAEHDDELLGVFAHEVGHVEHRHSLRHVLQDSITGLLIVMLTGDVGSASSMAAALPTVLMQTKFSRDFEREADRYAARFMQQKNLEPRHLANILQRLDESFADEDDNDFLSTHPLTKERAKYLINYKNEEQGEKHE